MEVPTSPRTTTSSRRERSKSFANIDEEEASGILEGVLKDSKAFLGGASVGKGLKKAAQRYLRAQKERATKELESLAEDALTTFSTPPEPILEDPFYIVDIGILVSQVYQWRRYFPRVEPFYAVKCNPDPVIVKTLAVLGCNFDCASATEIRIVQDAAREVLPASRNRPEIIYANPCKGRSHVVQALAAGVSIMTFDNVSEVHKLAGLSKDIQLVLRIITDDRGSRCRFSSKFGAPRMKWRTLLSTAKKCGLQVVGVSFHVGSGCRDASRYEAALQDAREVFDMAKKDYGFNPHIVDIGGGFPGETHSIWNPAVEIDDDDQDEEEGQKLENDEEDRFMYFSEIAQAVAPVLDQYFPPESGVRIIGEPGRYMVAASATLCCAVVSARSNELDTAIIEDHSIMDHDAARSLAEMSRAEEGELVRQRGTSMAQDDTDVVLATIQEELADYTKLFAAQQLAQQEVDVYNDSLDLFHEGFNTAGDLLGPPDESQVNKQHHTAEGLSYPLVSNTLSKDELDSSALVTLAAAGEAAVNGMVLQAVADSAPLQDDYAYYINDGVYGAFNNIMFDHATIRPRILRGVLNERSRSDGSTSSDESPYSSGKEDRALFASTVFGPTCDSIDIIARSVLLPKLKVGDWMYFQNMGAYTMAAASAFNGFQPSERFYVCSVMPEYFEALIKGPEETNSSEEKKEG